MNTLGGPKPEDTEAFHREAEAQVHTLRYEKPEQASKYKVKDLVWLVRRPLLRVLVQIVREGGENNLHYHTKSETSWIVLKGRAVFVGMGDTVLADIGPMEGIHIPGGARYKFYKEGEEDLEILQIVAAEDGGREKDERINYEPHKEWMIDEHLQKY